MKSGLPKLAVLIDGDNVAADAMDRLFETIATLGDPIMRIVYRGQTISKKWEQAAGRHALSFGRRHHHVTGHNATDIEMVIGAMDLLISAPVDGVCLVSSDADFTALAIRLREGGKVVYGWGQKAPECLRTACHQFFMIDPADTTARNNVVPFMRTGLEHAVAGIRHAIEKHAAQDGWAALSAIGAQLRCEIPGFKSQNYGAASLKKLALKAGCFDLRQTGRGQAVMRARSVELLPDIKTENVPHASPPSA